MNDLKNPRKPLQPPVAPIPAAALDAGRAGILHGNVRLESCPEGGEQLGQIAEGDWAAFSSVDFGDGVDNVRIRAAAERGALVELRLDGPDGHVVGECQLPKAGSLGAHSARIEFLSGVHELFVRFIVPGGALRVKELGFDRR